MKIEFIYMNIVSSPFYSSILFLIREKHYQWVIYWIAESLYDPSRESLFQSLATSSK